jgi:hypothetical protein
VNAAKLSPSGAFAVALMAAFSIAVGCSSSSSNPPAPVTDGGPDGNMTPLEDAGPDAAESCNPILGPLCGAGKTCCIAGIFGSCVDVGSCKAPIQVSCTTKANCGAGICCGSVQLPAGFDASAFDASDFDAASAANFDAAGFSLTIACADSCPEPGFQLCSTSQDCPSGYRCAGGGAGLGGFEGIVGCIPEDAGAGFPGPDSGAPDGGAVDAADGSDGGD